MNETKITHIYRIYTLLLLKTESRHGYEIIDEIEKMTGNEPSTSHIYPFLSELEDEGYLKSEKGGRGKKIYSLTKEGNKFVSEQLNSFGEILYTALKDRVKECSHCKCQIYDNGHEKNGKIYCCKHCAQSA